MLEWYSYLHFVVCVIGDKIPHNESKMLAYVLDLIFNVCIFIDWNFVYAGNEFRFESHRVLLSKITSPHRAELLFSLAFYCYYSDIKYTIMICSSPGLMSINTNKCVCTNFLKCFQLIPYHYALSLCKSTFYPNIGLKNELNFATMSVNTPNVVIINNSTTYYTHSAQLSTPRSSNITKKKMSIR